MKMTYELAVNGYDHELVEHAIRIMDTIVRRWYNVYGGYRAYSGKGAGGEYYVYMEYTANWSDTGFWPNWNDIRKSFYRVLNRVDKDDLLEVHTRPMPWMVNGKG